MAAWVMFSMLFPIAFLFLQLAIMKPMPHVESFNIYVQPLLWGLIFDAFLGLILLVSYIGFKLMD